MRAQVLTSRRFHDDIARCDQLRMRMLAFVTNLQYAVTPSPPLPAYLPWMP